MAELPAPPRFSGRNLFKVVGPGAILAATAIGGGEWLVGPAVAVKYSTSIFLVVTVAILLQLVFNIEAVRYTLYTGEPIYGGIMRLRPGPIFWAGFYALIGFLQIGWPGLAGSAAATLLSAWSGRLPGALDTSSIEWVTTALLAVIVLILSFGGTIERMLERFSWIMLAVIFSFLLFVNVVFVPLGHSWQTFVGFFQFTGFTTPIDWALIGALAATAGSGGLGNLTVTNWVRDKGFGMGSLVGAIPSAIGGLKIDLSPVGKVFAVTSESLARWREWMRYVHADQVFIWGLCCFAGMYLNVNLATYVAPPGADLEGLAAGAYQARHLADRFWPGFWALTLFNGFWILFKTALGNSDILVRAVTDALWMSSPKVSQRTGSIRKIYYGLLIILTLWSALAIRLASPLRLFTIFANMAGLILAIAAVQVLRVNRRFLPRELRPPLWREILLVLCAAFYTIFALFVTLSLIRPFISS